MKAEKFSLILLKNIWMSRDKRKVPFLGVIVLFVMKQGYVRRCEIINESGINCASFYSTMNQMIDRGLIEKKKTANRRSSLYSITEEGNAYYRELFRCKTEELAEKK